MGERLDRGISEIISSWAEMPDMGNISYQGSCCSRAFKSGSEDRKTRLKIAQVIKKTHTGDY